MNPDEFKTLLRPYMQEARDNGYQAALRDVLTFLSIAGLEHHADPFTLEGIIAGVEAMQHAHLRTEASA